MAAPTLTEIAAAAARMRSIVESRVSGDYAPATVLGDLVIDAHAVIYADMYAKIQGSRDNQSLLALREAVQTNDTRDATRALLGNLFVVPGAGTFARGVVTLHFTQKVDTLLPRTTRFTKALGLIYYPDAPSDTLIQASQMRPLYGDRGELVSWTYNVTVVAARTGTAYRASAGRFVAVDPFTPYLAYAENRDAFGGGDDPDSNAQAIARAETALSIRTFLNARSNDATLRAAFAELLLVRTIGMGDPEMVRDILDATTFGVEVHRGGHVDIYTDLPVQRATVRLVVGEETPRADNLVTRFTQAGATFVTSGVRVGQVLRITSGLPDAPRDYKVLAVTETTIDVRTSTPFYRATDEDVSPGDITYSIGDNYPLFDNKVSSAARAARTTRNTSFEGHVVLPAGPVGAITRVEILNPPSELAAFTDPSTGTALFSLRRSKARTRAPLAGEPLSYRVICHNPSESQSMLAVTSMELGWDGVPLTGAEVLVTYETQLGFSALDLVVRDAQTRVPGANTLPKAAHPVYVSATVPYRQRTIPATSTDVVRAVDESAVTRALVDLIARAPVEGLDVGALTTVASRADSNLGTVFPFSIYYEALLPDGRVASYQTEDRVTLFPAEGTSARLLNAADFGLESSDTAGITRLLTRLGISNRVVRYHTSTDLITLSARS